MPGKSTLCHIFCHCACQTGVTGDKGPSGDKGITGNAGEFAKTSCTLFQETVNTLYDQICISCSMFGTMINNSQ